MVGRLVVAATLVRGLALAQPMPTLDTAFAVGIAHQRVTLDANWMSDHWEEWSPKKRKEWRRRLLSEVPTVRAILDEMHCPERQWKPAVDLLQSKLEHDPVDEELIEAGELTTPYGLVLVRCAQALPAASFSAFYAGIQIGELLGDFQILDDGRAKAHDTDAAMLNALDNLNRVVDEVVAAPGLALGTKLRLRELARLSRPSRDRNTLDDTSRRQIRSQLDALVKQLQAR